MKALADRSKLKVFLKVFSPNGGHSFNARAPTHSSPVSEVLKMEPSLEWALAVKIRVSLQYRQL